MRGVRHKNDLTTLANKHWDQCDYFRLIPFLGNDETNSLNRLLAKSYCNDAGRLAVQIPAFVKELGALKTLQELYLNGCNVTDAGLKELAGLKRLQVLRLDQAQVDPEISRGLSERTTLGKASTRVRLPSPMCQGQRQSRGIPKVQAHRWPKNMQPGKTSAK